MKSKVYILSISMAIGALFASCDTDNMNDTFTETTIGACFNFGAQSVTLPAEGYEGFDVEVTRANTNEAATVAINASMADGSAVPAEFQVPSSVSFEAGEGNTMIHVSVGDIESGVTYQLVISVDETMAPTFAGAITSKTVSVFRDYTYTSLGEGSLVSSFYGGEGTMEVQKADNINWYKAISPYEEGYDVIFQVMEDGTSVTISQQAIAADYGGYGTLYVAGSGTLENGVITATLEFTVSAGSFGEFEEVFTLPVE